MSFLSIDYMMGNGRWSRWSGANRSVQRRFGSVWRQSRTIHRRRRPQAWRRLIDRHRSRCRVTQNRSGWRSAWSRIGPYAGPLSSVNRAKSGVICGWIVCDFHVQRLFDRLTLVRDRRLISSRMLGSHRASQLIQQLSFVCPSFAHRSPLLPICQLGLLTFQPIRTVATDRWRFGVQQIISIRRFGRRCSRPTVAHVLGSFGQCSSALNRRWRMGNTIRKRLTSWLTIKRIVNWFGGRLKRTL